MYPSALLGVFAGLTVVAFGQDDVSGPGPYASDADVALVAQELQNVISAVTTLDNQVTGYFGPYYNASLQAASNEVIAALYLGAGRIAPIFGDITITQAALSLLGPTGDLNNIVSQTVSDAIAQKPLFVASCIGPTILDSLNAQLNASEALVNNILSKFYPGPLLDLAASQSQMALDSLGQAIANYSDQTSLPATCPDTYYPDMEDNQAAIVGQQLNNVISAVTGLDTGVTSYTGPSDNSTLLAAAENLIATLYFGASSIVTLSGYITIGEAIQYLLNTVNDLDNIVAQTVNDAMAQKQLFVDSCIGPTILLSLNQQLNASQDLIDVVEDKFPPGSDLQSLAAELAQPALDSLNQAIADFSDQTTLPASCSPTTTTTSRSYPSSFRSSRLSSRTRSSQTTHSNTRKPSQTTRSTKRTRSSGTPPLTTKSSTSTSLTTTTTRPITTPVSPVSSGSIPTSTSKTSSSSSPVTTASSGKSTPSTPGTSSSSSAVITASSGKSTPTTTGTSSSSSSPASVGKPTTSSSPVVISPTSKSLTTTSTTTTSTSVPSVSTGKPTTSSSPVVTSPTGKAPTTTSSTIVSPTSASSTSTSSKSVSPTSSTSTSPTTSPSSSSSSTTLTTSSTSKTTVTTTSTTSTHTSTSRPTTSTAPPPPPYGGYPPWGRSPGHDRPFRGFPWNFPA